MFSTTETDIGQKLLQALKAYGLTSGEAGATVQLTNTLSKLGLEAELNADGLAIEIGSKKIVEFKRQQEVSVIIKQFIGDFVTACRIDVNSGHCLSLNHADGSYSFKCGNIAVSSLNEGANRAINDVLFGLDKMIVAKKLGHSLAA